MSCGKKLDYLSPEEFASAGPPSKERGAETQANTRHYLGTSVCRYNVEG